MGGEFPLLDVSQVEKILKKAGFTVKRQRSSHVDWEGTAGGLRRLVTVDQLKSKKEQFGHRLLKDMIEQSGMTRKQFYSYL